MTVLEYFERRQDMKNGEGYPGIRQPGKPLRMSVSFPGT